MKTIFDKIYILSLIVNHDRQEFIKYQMKEFDIDFEFIYGTDFYNLKYDSVNNKIIYPNVWPKGWNDNKSDFSLDYGCALSHYNAILFAYELGYNNVLIIEDDVCFIKNKILLKTILNNIPEDADYITWDPRFLNIEDYNLYKSVIDNNIYTYITDKYSHFMAGGMMYALMNRKTMEIYLNNQRISLKMPDQVEEFNINNKTIKKYVCNHCICTDQLNIKYNFNFKLVNDFSFTYINSYSIDNKLNKNMFYNPKIYNLFSR